MTANQSWQQTHDTPDFRICINVHDYYMDFAAYEVEGEYGGRELIISPLKYFSGSVKWDGCANVRFDEQDNVMLHFCGRNDAMRIARLIEKIYDLAEANIPTFDRKCAE